MIATLNNRELATGIWLCFIGLLIICIPSVRKSIIQFLKIFSDKKILVLLILMIFYVVIVIYLLYKINFWNKHLLKDSFLWLFGAGLLLLMNVNKALKDENHFKEIVKENIKWALIVEFAINLYVFNLIIELFLLPTISFLFILQMVSQSERKYHATAKLINAILKIFGLILITYVSYKFSTDFNNFVTLENFESFLLPIILTFAYIPFLYFMAIFMLYEDFFVRMNMAFRHNKLLNKYAKWKIFREIGLNLFKARKLSKELRIFSIGSKHELNEAILKINY